MDNQILKDKIIEILKSSTVTNGLLKGQYISVEAIKEIASRIIEAVDMQCVTSQKP
jgi:hypothetical protein